MGACSCGSKIQTDHNITTPHSSRSSGESIGKGAGAAVTQALNRPTKFKPPNVTSINDESDDNTVTETETETEYKSNEAIKQPEAKINNDNLTHPQSSNYTTSGSSITKGENKLENTTQLDDDKSKSTTEIEHKYNENIQQSNPSEIETDHHRDILSKHISKILQDYKIQIDENHLWKTFQKHKYVKKQLVDDLCTIFNKNSDKDVTLSNIVSDLGFTAYDDRKKIYDLLLHS
eukprot:375076_1